MLRRMRSSRKGNLLLRNTARARKSRERLFVLNVMMTSTLIFRYPFINKPVAEHKCCINQAICEFLSIFIDLTNISNKIFCFSDFTLIKIHMNDRIVNKILKLNFCIGNKKGEKWQKEIFSWTQTCSRESLGIFKARQKI